MAYDFLSCFRDLCETAKILLLMTKEQIEKATDEYIGYAREVDEGLGTTMRRHAFMDGAQWRINSVWHDASEVPEVDKRVLVCFENVINEYIYYRIKVFKPNVIKNWNKQDSILDKVIRWAYIDDLLLERKEENNGGC